MGSSNRRRRRMRWIGQGNVITIEVGDSSTASRISRFWSAVKRYIETGNDDQLRRFHGRSIRVQDRTYPVVTDTRALDQLGRRGELSFETIYAESM